MGYAGENPLRFVDGNGLEQTESGEGQKEGNKYSAITVSKKDMESVMSYMQELTSDKLSAQAIVGKHGKIKGYNIVIAEQSEGEANDGTRLVRELINSEAPINIELGDFRSDTFPQMGIISIHLRKESSSVPTEDKMAKDGVSMQAFQKSIELGHELIHALHIITNYEDYKFKNIPNSYFVEVYDPIKKTQVHWESDSNPEEQRTVFGEGKPGEITENGLRMQLGLALRKYY